MVRFPSQSGGHHAKSIQGAVALPALASALLATSALAQFPAEPDAPEDAVVLKLHGVGAQLYECKAGPEGKLVWTFREPVASLMLKRHSMRASTIAVRPSSTSTAAPS
ncbi:MAG: DUF3455 domain-containing protein [Xanthobacteraceae bacterium]